MPLHKNPQNLKKISLKILNEVLVSKVREIQSTLGKYGQKGTIEKCARLSSSLGESLPSEVLTELCEQRKFTYGVSQLDPRLFLACFIHKGLTMISLDQRRSSNTPRSVANTAEFYRPHSPSINDGWSLHSSPPCARFCCEPYLDEEFWWSCFIHVPKLTFISLPVGCVTDNLMYIISVTCPLLQEFVIFSCLHAPEYSENCSPEFSCGCYLSNSGLRLLKDCKDLRRISIPSRRCDRQLCICYQGRIDELYDTVFELLRYLSKLEHISFDDVANVLKRGSKVLGQSLPLIYLRQCNPTEESIKFITRMCPKITNLELIWEQQQTFEDGIKSLSKLTEKRNLQVERLGVSGMMFTELFTVFSIIGPNLIELNLELEDNCVCYNLLSLGNICPNLEILKLQYFFGENLYSFDTTDYEAHFPKLKSLDIAGSGWNPEIVLKLLLSSSYSLEEAFIALNTETTAPIDISSWLNFVTAEPKPLSNLKYLELWKSFTLTKEAINLLYTNCHELRYISFYTNSENVISDCQRMQRKCDSYNIDFLIDCHLIDYADVY